MEGGYDRHLEAPEESQNVTARWAAKDSVLVLQTYQIEIREIQKVGGLLIRGQIVLRQRESYPLWVRISGFHIVDRNGV